MTSIYVCMLEVCFVVVVVVGMQNVQVKAVVETCKMKWQQAASRNNKFPEMKRWLHWLPAWLAGVLVVALRQL